MIPDKLHPKNPSPTEQMPQIDRLPNTVPRLTKCRLSEHFQVMISQMLIQKFSKSSRCLPAKTLMSTNSGDAVQSL